MLLWSNERNGAVLKWTEFQREIPFSQSGNSIGKKKYCKIRLRTIL